jgi:hypothetical protein
MRLIGQPEDIYTSAPGQIPQKGMHAADRPA